MSRPRRSLKLVTAPTTEPINVTDAKGWARISTDDDDVLVAQLVTAARMAAEEYLRRSLMNQTWKLTLDLCASGLDGYLGEGVYDLPQSILYGGLPETIPLPKGPVSSITSVTTYDTSNTATTFASTNYRVDTSDDRLVLNYGCSWPSGLRAQSAVEIVYVAGYGPLDTDVPQAIKTAITIHFASLYEQRGQCEDAMDLPPGAKQLLNQYRVMGDRLG